MQIVLKFVAKILVKSVKIMFKPLMPNQGQNRKESTKERANSHGQDGHFIY